ncbi:MAG TPA: hypothetical protein DD401_04525 [Prevotella sp.]|nr:hypothetical protein [Prevotella sp.]
MKRLFLSIAMTLMAFVSMLASHTVTQEGAWCWFADPRALHYENASGSINASYLGYIDVHGNVKATQMDFVHNRRTEVLVRSAFQPDDHNNPTFIVLPDERVMIFYTRHTDEPKIWYRVSVKPGDISELGEEKFISTKNNTTYPSPFILSDDPSHIYLCWRGINWHPTMARITMPDANDDVTVDFGPKQIVQSTGARPYAKYQSNGKDKIYLAYTTGHPDNEMPNWLYFNVIDINKGKGPILRDIKGNKLKTVADGPFNVNKTSSYLSQYPYTVVDHSDNVRNWVWQIALDKEERPVIALVHIDNAKTTHVYHYGRWTGKAWSDTWLQYGGHAFHQNWNRTERCYSGGMAIDPDDTHLLYLSIPTTNGAYDKDGIYEIWKYTIADDGTIASTEQVTRNSAKNNMRPFMLPGSKNSKLRLTWMNGDYYYWMVNKNYPKGYPTSIVCDYDLPEQPVNLADQQMKQAAGNTAFSVAAQLHQEASREAADTTWIFGSDNLTVGLSASNQLFVNMKANGEQTTKTSCNLFNTSDNWALYSTGTSGDTHLTTITDALITVTYDGSELRLYRNELLELCIPAKGLTLSNVKAGALSTGTQLWGRALNQDEVGALRTQFIASLISVPDTVRTDLVLPQTVQGLPVTWSSSNTAVIANNGIVCLPSEETPVTLTATVGADTVRWQTVVMPRNVEKNLLVSYTFDEADLTADNTVADHSGHGRKLAVKGSAKVNGTLDLTANKPVAFAANGYGVAPAGLVGALRSYTFMLDVKLNGREKLPRFYDFGSGSGNSVFLRLTAAGNYSAGSKMGGGQTLMVESAKVMPLGKTVHLAVTFNAADHRLAIYADGEKVAEGNNVTYEPWQLVSQAQDTRNYIGRTQWWDNNTDNGDVVGTIDNFRLYDIALTQAEIQQANTPTAIKTITKRKRSSRHYTLAGQPVNLTAMAHGIYVTQGRKYLKR